MRPVFFKLTLWNDPQEWDVCPIFRDACRAANRQDLRSPRESPAVDFIDLIDYSVWEEAWVDSLREAFELSE